MVGEIEERIDLVQDIGDGDEEVMESAPLVRCRHCARYSDGWCSEWMHSTIGSGYCYMSEEKASVDTRKEEMSAVQ